MTISQLTAVINEMIILCLLSMNQSDSYYPCSQYQYQCINRHCRVTNTDQLVTTSQCDLFYTVLWYIHCLQVLYLIWISVNACRQQYILNFCCVCQYHNMILSTIYTFQRSPYKEMSLQFAIELPGHAFVVYSVAIAIQGVIYTPLCHSIQLGMVHLQISCTQSLDWAGLKLLHELPVKQS